MSRTPTMQAFMTRFLRSPCLSTIPIPKPSHTELLIKVDYVSLNPTDRAFSSFSLPPSKVVGCDFSGTVTSLGQAVDQSTFSPGDRIAGMIHGCNASHTGAFAEHLVADANLCFKIPDSVSLEDACTFGVGWTSALQALDQRLYKDDRGPFGSDDTLLIYSAATNMGMHAIQQTRIYHLSTKIVAIAAKQNHEMLRKLGADEVFDYRSRTLVEDVRGLGRDIRRGIDCHSQGESTSLAAQCMLPKDGIDDLVGNDRRRIIRSLPPRMAKGEVPSSVRTDENILTYTAAGKPFRLFFKYYAAVPENYETASKYLRALTPLLEEKKVVPVRHRLMPGGLGDIGKGFEEMKAGKVRGEKLVYKVGGEVKA